MAKEVILELEIGTSSLLSCVNNTDYNIEKSDNLTKQCINSIINIQRYNYNDNN